MADDTTRGVHLNEKQVVFVLMAAGVICGVMFLFGVLVGRGVQSERGPVAEGALIGAPQVVPDFQPTADAAYSKPAGSQVDDLSYPKRLTQPEPPAERLKTQATTARALPSATPAGRASAIDAPVAPPEPQDEPPAAAPPEPAAARPFSVQVATVRKRSEADLIVKRLKAQGYEVRVVPPEAGDRTGVFRVKVGPYKTRRDADVAVRKIESEGKYKPWVTR